MQKLKFVKEFYGPFNATHGQNINLPVCVCVCPSHFPSTRLQVRPLNGDSLKDADLHKDVPFGVSMMNKYI